MIVKFFNNGNVKNKSFVTGGNGVKDYLLNERVENDTAKLLEGNPDATTEIINGLKFSTIYKAGCLSFDKDESLRVDDQLKQTLMKDFERALFGDFDKSRLSGYWVEHTDKERLELNFVYACVDLATGKALPVYYHQNDLHRIDTFKELANLKHGLSDPNAPEHKATTSIANRLPLDKKLLKQAINDHLTQLATADQLADHGAVKAALNDLGLEITNIKKSSISIKDPTGSNRPIRLTGAFYEQKYQLSNIINSAENRPIQDDRADRISELSSKLETSIRHRTESLNERFKQPTPTADRPDKKQSPTADPRPDQPTPTANGQSSAVNQRTTNRDKRIFEYIEFSPGQTWRTYPKPRTTDQRLSTADNRESASDPKTVNDTNINTLDFGRFAGRIITIHDILGTPKNDKDKPILRPVQRANDSIFQQFSEHCRQLFTGFEKYTESSYQRLSDTAKATNKRISDRAKATADTFAKYAPRYASVNSELGRAVATTTENNQRLDRASHTAKQASSSLERMFERIEKDRQQQQQQQKQQPKPTNAPKPQQEQPKATEAPKRPEPPKPRPKPRP